MRIDEIHRLTPSLPPKVYISPVAPGNNLTRRERKGLELTIDTRCRLAAASKRSACPTIGRRNVELPRSVRCNLAQGSSKGAPGYSAGHRVELKLGRDGAHEKVIEADIHGFAFWLGSHSQSHEATRE